jgi:DNA helicase II / ATP-dependent DNA helicase PcrA
LPLVARKPATESPALNVKVFDDEDAEVAVIPTTIKKMRWNVEDCAVLARSTKLLLKAAMALSDSGFIPHLAQRKNEFECASISWMHAVLRLANARHDREFLRRICVAWKAFTDIVIEVEDIEAVAALNGGDFLRAWVDSASSKANAIGHDELLSRIRHDLVDRLSFIKLLEWFWTQKWLDDELETEEMNTWQDLHEALLREHSPDNMTLRLYLQEMDLKSKAAARLPGSIPCLTVHGSKGLEFKHVFLIGMADEVFPSYQAVRKGSDSSEIEEERRNCFVAITRVKETLNISWARTYNGFPKRPSRFLEEMGFTFRKF